MSIAERKFIDAIEQQRDFSLAYYNLGVVYAELNKIDAAESCFQKAIELDPEIWEAYYALGIAVFRRGKEIEQTYEILGFDLNDEALKAEKDKKVIALKEKVEQDYKNSILLCERVLEIRSRQDSFFDIYYPIRAKLFNLKGNAQVRSTRTNCPAKKFGEPCKEHKAINCRGLGNAKKSLEKAVHSSWMALIKESILNETVEDESKIVSECSLDLANIYLKMQKCRGNTLSGYLAYARSMLGQAIYINPNEVSLYQLLGMASEDQMKEFENSVSGKIRRAIRIQRDPSKDFARNVYCQALRIKPESSQLKVFDAK